MLRRSCQVEDCLKYAEIDKCRQSNMSVEVRVFSPANACVTLLSVDRVEHFAEKR